MIEQLIQIPLSGEVRIKGKLVGRSGDKVLLIFVPGFLSNSQNHLIYNASVYLSRFGFVCFSYDQYGSTANERKLDDTPYQTSVKDLEEVVDYFSVNYQKIYLIAHSLGAFVAAGVDRDKIAGYVFWEPSLHPEQMFSYLGKEDPVLVDIGYKVMIPNQIIETYRNLPPAEELFSPLDKPVKVIGAEKGGAKIGKAYSRLRPGRMSFSLIREANHNFDSVKCEKQLFRITLDWLRKNTSF